MNEFSRRRLPSYCTKSDFYSFGRNGNGRIRCAVRSLINRTMYNCAYVWSMSGASHVDAVCVSSREDCQISRYLLLGGDLTRRQNEECLLRAFAYERRPQIRVSPTSENLRDSKNIGHETNAIIKPKIENDEFRVRFSFVYVYACMMWRRVSAFVLVAIFFISHSCSSELCRVART